ncbi:MAG: AAA family ATPase [Gammaproteobacteria bacterium]|nr:AAA family ATPase [Gammaproteobacteria bacterium]
MNTPWDEKASPTPGVRLVCASSITPEPIDWIWPDWLAAGKLHVLAGMAGTGKTTIALAVAATLTVCGRWPNGIVCGTPADVVMWSGEDDAADTLVPRLLAMGADVTRVHLITATVDNEGQKRGFDPANDMALLESALTKFKPRLLILDPISSAVSGDSHQNTEVRRSLQPVVDLAARIGCAVLGITHFTKGTAGRDPLERVTGSLAFGAFARLVWATIKPGKDAEDQKRRLIRTKSNIGPDGGGVEYDMEQAPVPGHAGLWASSILWGESLEGSARELAGQIEEERWEQERGPSPREEATEFLLGVLADGPKLQKEIAELADQEGITPITLKRAKKGLGIPSTKAADGWLWSLPRVQRDQEGHISVYRKTDSLDPLDDPHTAETQENRAFRQEGQGDHFDDGEEAHIVIRDGKAEGWI